jgi:signal transduction histidine kinase
VIGQTARVTRVGEWLLAAFRLAAAVVTALVALVLLLALVTGLVLVPVFGVGVPVVAGALGATRALTELHRREAGRVLGVPLAGSYTSQPSWSWRDLLTCLRDQQNGRDAIWLAAHGVAGVVVFWIAYALLAALSGLAVGAGGPFSVLTFPVLVIAAVIWWMVPWTVRGLALLARVLLAPSDAGLARRIEQLTESRAAAVDAQAAELRRIERDLHDGAQARLAALRMTLGLAAQAVRSDPDQAAALLEEARADAGKALAELRDLVRGIHPPVLADRGLVGGLEAAALLCPVPVALDIDLPLRPQAPVESALYFATAEVLANVGTHSGATTARLRVRYASGVLSVVVGDDGRGGADPRRGTGLRGIERRLAAFDGTLRVTSPSGGPTEITMELPCTLPAPVSGPSSPRTTSSSATA